VSGLAAFNAADRDDLARDLRTCLRAEQWVRQVLALRPYPDLPSLLTAAQDAAERMDTADLQSALAAHPRIGQRRRGSGPEAEASRREQAGIRPDPSGPDGELAARLAAGNAEYERRFGHLFLIRAAGRTAPEILKALEQRLRHDEETEAVVVRQQLGEIAALRLERLLATLDRAAVGR
jgi:2-oxo-4-hydroxy-4-carboxy-5-ureidoimidazoline decarboxylase